MMTTQILEALQTDRYQHEAYGIRTDETEYAIGDSLNNSFDQTDEGTGEELEGTCTTGIKLLWHDEDDMESIAKAVKVHQDNNYFGSHVYLVGGEYGESGNDDGELLIRNAQVVAILR